MFDPVEIALNELGIDPDHDRQEDGAYLTSMIDLRITGDDYVYVTVVWTDNGDSEKVAVVRVVEPANDPFGIIPAQAEIVSEAEL